MEGIYFMANIESIIRNSELFSGIDTDTVNRITLRFLNVVFEKDEFLCREGDTGNCMFILTGGQVSIQKEMGWGQREVMRLSTGEVVGEMCLISNEKRSATVQALERTTCLQMNREDFADLLNTEPHFAQQVAIILTERLADLGRNTSDEILNAYRSLMFSLASLADSRDPETGAHLNRTRRYCALLAERVQSTGIRDETIPEGFSQGIYQVSPLHDIGKVAIPDRILLKPGRLTEDEFAAMKLHSTVGAQSLQVVLEYSNQKIFHMAYDICLHHHEKWDGSGYPYGLKGEDIPLEARIMALADVYDALLSKRVYKPAMTNIEANSEIERSAGTHFDPVLAEIWLKNIHEFEAVHRQFTGE